jgi:hypothetical protein
LRWRSRYGFWAALSSCLQKSLSFASSEWFLSLQRFQWQSLVAVAYVIVSDCSACGPVLPELDGPWTTLWSTLANATRRDRIVPK